jgi:hypothetical protein
MPLSETIAPTQLSEGKEIEIRVARSLPEVEALREPWVGWSGHRDSDIDFYLMIVQSYPEVVRPHVIALYRNGKPDAILVGRLERKRLRFGVGYLPAFRPWARCLTFVYGAIRGDASPQNTEMLLREVMKSLKRDEADLAMLELVPLASALYRLALKVPGILIRDALPAPQGHDSLTIPDSIDDVYRRMSRERRKHTKASIKKLETTPAGKPKILCYRNPPELDNLFRDAEEISKKTYQRGLSVGFSDNHVVRTRLELGARKGWLRAYVLYLGDRPCAFWIGMRYGETFMSDYMGYDPEFRRFSPGMVLLMRVIEGFCNRADGDIVKELDFGPGPAEYKGVLCSSNWLEAVVYIFGPTPKGLLLKSMRTATRVVDASARRILATTKLLPRLKRLWRDRMAKRGQLPPNTEKPTADRNHNPDRAEATK